LLINKKKIENYLESIERLTNKLEYLSKLVLTIFMIEISIMCASSVFSRFILNYSISWSNEILRYSYIYIVFIGTAVSFKEGTHAKMEMLYTKSPKFIKNIITIINTSIMIFISCLFIVLGINEAIKKWHVNAPVINFFPIGMLYLSIVICGFLLLVFILWKIIKKQYQ